MAERYKSIFFTTITLVVVWFLIILLCLSQSNTIEQWSSTEPSPRHAALESSLNEVVDFIEVDKSNNNDPLGIITSRDNKGNRNNLVKSSHVIHSPLSPDFLKNLQTKHKVISADGILFYQFDLHPRELSNSSTITKDQHDRDTLRLGQINNPADQYIKSEGHGLFAFNLLVSNRIGLYRPLPDTRNAKCINHAPSQSPPSSFLEEQNPDNNNQLKSSRYHPNTSNILATPTIELKASIIICYYNEAPSALLRTIYSVLKRSPIELLEEIIVVDDFSSHEYNYNKIKAFVSSDLVKLVRTNKREGLIRARLFGVDRAKGDVLVFLDSHVEANVGWLEPLLRVIQDNSTTICCPMIDLINSETLIYSASPMVRGGLNWALNFKWDSVPSQDLKTYDDFVKPIQSPTMAGGLYAIDRNYFKKLGEYDRGMDLWGGENIELSLRTWMCGGKIVILSCSRVGHIFRKRRPYGPEPDQPDSLLVNSHRTARVWLDEYIDKFYEANPDARYLMSGDVSQRLELRQNLGCQNFSWYLNNIYPALKKELGDQNETLPPKLFDRVPIQSVARDVRKSNNPYSSLGNHRKQRQALLGGFRSRLSNKDSPSMSERYHSKHMQHTTQLPTIISQFQIQSAGSNLCMESTRGFLAKGFTRLVLNYCAEVIRNSDNDIVMANNNSTLTDQLWSETELHDYRLGDNQCLDLLKNLPILNKCHKMRSFQEWTHNNKSSDTTISNRGATLCLGVERVRVGEPIIVTICDVQSDENGGSVAQPAAAGLSAKLGKRNKHFDKLYPRWQTSSDHYERRFLGVGAMKALRLKQTWNLLIVSDATKQEQSNSSSTMRSSSSAVATSATGYERKEEMQYLQ